MTNTPTPVENQQADANDTPEENTVENQQASPAAQKEFSLKQVVFMRNVLPAIQHLHQVCTDNGIPCAVNAIIADEYGSKDVEFHTTMNNVDYRVAQHYPAFLIGNAFVNDKMAADIGLGDYAVEAFGNLFTKTAGESDVVPDGRFVITPIEAEEAQKAS